MASTPPRLGRRLGIADVVVLGVVGMLGSGVFIVFSPAGAAAGPWLPLAVLIAAAVAGCCVLSTSELAMAHRGPDSRGGPSWISGHTAGYVAARRRLHPAAGRVAGIALLIGGIASAAAAAGVFGAYVLPSNPLAAAIVVIVAASAMAIVGVRTTARSAWLIAGGTLAVLVVVVVVGLLGPGGGSAGVSAAAATGGDSLASGVAVPAVTPPRGVLGVLSAAGLVFFAFVGFADAASAREDIRSPVRTLRRAVPIALGICAVAYLAVAAALLVGLGSSRIGAEHSPLVALVDTGQAPALGVLVRIGAAVAAGSTLFALLIGLTRTAGAMARRDDLPRALARRCGSGAAWRADVLGAGLAIVVAVLAGPVASIALAACALLIHYALVHAAVLRLPQLAGPRWIPVVGLVACLGLAAFLPPVSVLITLGLIAVGWVPSELWALRMRRRPVVEEEGAAPPDEQAA
ncbi:amino acid permease [Pseudonocardia ailaonensis]|uniref:Amino acid permease n=1 Tax=Pseudonocardia ailaonensis TaxID=367279 RepID=A0ABN2N2G9_9PSEU